MAIFTVHERRDSIGGSSWAERIVLVREGFSFPALIFGPIWLLWNRLWLGLMLWLAAEGAIMALGYFVLRSETGTTLLELIVGLVVGFEASQLRRAALSRRGYDLVEVVSAPREESAERIFFDSHALGDEENVRRVHAAGHRAPQAGMVGLFPSMEGPGS